MSFYSNFKIQSEIVDIQWWNKSINLFYDKVFSKLRGNIIILYNADTDGFIASYFIYKLGSSRN